jgi:hypothetical protein
LLEELLSLPDSHLHSREEMCPTQQEETFANSPTPTNCITAIRNHAEISATQPLLQLDIVDGLTEMEDLTFQL